MVGVFTPCWELSHCGRPSVLHTGSSEMPHLPASPCLLPLQPAEPWDCPSGRASKRWGWPQRHPAIGSPIS